MTLIAFNTNKDRADILTDTSAYTHGGRDLFSSSKIQPIPHLDMAYATQGDCRFAAAWRFDADLLSKDMATFDDFAQEVGTPLRAAWEYAAQNPAIESSAVFLIGYSPKAGRFRAYQFDSGSDFERCDIEAPFIIPTPFDRGVSGMEWTRLRDRFTEERRPGMLADLEIWHQKPPLVAPTTVNGWVQLGKDARASRAMVPNGTGVKVFVAGDLFHSVLRRGEFRTSRVHRFNDSGAEFAQMVAGTLHPVSQHGPCVCGSGRPYVECCLVPYATKECTCGSGQLFQACCSVQAEETDTAPAQLDRQVRAIPTMQRQMAR